MVPYNIATRELLPSIKRNPKFINDNAFQVVDRNGRVVDPSTVNWKSLGPSYFPYTIRQSTGCDNALGLIKLDFYNPFSVYLHDTPDKSLFQLNKRYFSHGCMRMEKPMELGHLVLKNNGIAIDTLEEKGCIRNQAPIVVKADEKMPVIVWYNPAGIDQSGRVIYYEDVYRRFRWNRLEAR
jgi:murein L,D-transpeptidase YcbB/YkuD